LIKELLLFIKVGFDRLKHQETKSHLATFIMEQIPTDTYPF